VPSTSLEFNSSASHRAWLATQSALPSGFKCATAKFDFTPVEAPKPSKMAVTILALDNPSESFAAVFTKNAFPGAPVIIGRKRLASPRLGAVVVNNKISNVCAPGGVESSEQVCAAAARALGIEATEVLPSSTGVIGWRLPVDAMVGALPSIATSLEGGSILPAAQGIVTTDLYPKVRRAEVAGGSIVGIAKGAGMIEPNMATMLVFIVTDLAVPRAGLRTILSRVVAKTFNRISVDSDTSTSDTVALLSSCAKPCGDLAAFEKALHQVCADLAEDVVRNGEGVRHVIRVKVSGATDEATAAALGKAVVNAPLFKCAVAGNDPNVGRLIQAIGKHAGVAASPIDLRNTRARIGGMEIFGDGVFKLDREKEVALTAHFKNAELYASARDASGHFTVPVDFPRHERCVEIEVDLGAGGASATVLGADLTHEYVSENADYRS
jgi:glutamate N-acetyltransferase/amino-acid N-acetyltransferase